MSGLLAQAVDASNNDAYLWWGIALSVIALVLFLVEFAIPSGGLIALLSGTAAIGSIFAFFMHSNAAGALALGIYVVGTPILLVFVFKLWLNSPLSNRMVLGGNKDLAEPGEESYHESVKVRAERLSQMQGLIGAKGKTITSLRPVGVVKIDGQRIDAMAESGVIESNIEVVVTEIYDNQVKVKPSDEIK